MSACGYIDMNHHIFRRIAWRRKVYMPWFYPPFKLGCSGCRRQLHEALYCTILYVYLSRWQDVLSHIRHTAPKVATAVTLATWLQHSLLKYSNHYYYVFFFFVFISYFVFSGCLLFPSKSIYTIPAAWWQRQQAYFVGMFLLFYLFLFSIDPTQSGIL